MPPSYTLDAKIEALNLLDQHDGDLRLVKKRLGIPLKTLAAGASMKSTSAVQYEDRQYRHFANRKLELLNDIFETCRDTMNSLTKETLGSRYRRSTRLYHAHPAHSRGQIGGTV